MKLTNIHQVHYNISVKANYFTTALYCNIQKSLLFHNKWKFVAVCRSSLIGSMLLVCCFHTAFFSIDKTNIEYTNIHWLKSIADMLDFIYVHATTYTWVSCFNLSKWDANIWGYMETFSNWHSFIQAILLSEIWASCECESCKPTLLNLMLYVDPVSPTKAWKINLKN